MHINGTLNNPIIDSELSDAEALAQNPQFLCPSEILEYQIVLKVLYYSFDEKIHSGQIVLDKRLQDDVSVLFEALLQERFPLASVIPIAGRRFHWDDIISMTANNSSGFNYRMMTVAPRISLHGYGQAIDLNPSLNPYIRGDLTLPPGATYDITRPGTVRSDSFIVTLMEKRGWEWGGRWQDRVDYQHFQKKL